VSDSTSSIFALWLAAALFFAVLLSICVGAARVRYRRRVFRTIDARRRAKLAATVERAP